METRKFSTMELVTMALLAALLCVSSYISVRLPFSAVPITAQSIIVNMIALMLAPKKAGLTIVVWILLGCIGLPVFSNGQSGIGVLAGPTGGYIIGYLVAAILISLLRHNQNKTIRNLIVTIAVGIPVIYLLGAVRMAAVVHVGWKTAIATGVLPFIVGDILKCVIAVYLVKPIYRFVHQE